jgi:pimeloyl-ACP methyl ester carboxylesterase
MEPFEIDVPRAALDDLARRLDEARWVPDFANGDWRYGVNGEALAELVDYWRTEFDWRAQEAAMNRFPHYRTEIEGVPIHFIHVRGRDEGSIPLVMTHGWPWTFWDFRDVIGPLADPAAHGAVGAPCFDVIVPSLPGFGFSSPLTQPGIGFGRTADLWHRLMTETLGYERYAAHGGDWGAMVTAALGHRYADHLYGIHESLPGFLGLDYGSLQASDYGPTEVGWFEHTKAMEAKTASHMAVHSLDPQTLAYALNDSPIGLLAWILERRRAWSDCDGDVERCFTKDDLLTTVSIYWLTGTVGTSLRFYWKNAQHPWQPIHDRQPPVEAPAAFAVFPKDVLLVPLEVARRYANVQRWTVMPRGGHFAAAEQPELLVDDLRAFFGAPS